MIQPLGGFGGFGSSLGIAPLSLSSPSLSTDAFGSLSLGASNFAMSNPAMSLIAQGYGTGRSSYSPFGVSGMYGSIGLGAPMLGGLNFAGPGPNFLNMNELFMQLWSATFGPKPSTPGGSSQASAPQPVADDTGNVGGARKTGKADEADEDKADGATAAGQAKGDAAKSDWKANVGNAFKGTGARVADTADTEGKRVVRLVPETGFDPKTSRSKLAKALQTLHRNGVQTAMIGDDAVQTGHRVTSKTKKNAKGQFIKTWEPNTRGVLRALNEIAPKASPTPPAAVAPTGGGSAAVGDVGAALIEPLRKVTVAKYAVPADNKSHRIVVKVDKGAKTDEVAGQMVIALDAAEKSMRGKASGQQISVAFSGEKAEAEAAQKKFDELYKKHTNAKLPPIISFAEVKKT